MSERGRRLTSDWSHELEHDGSALVEFAPAISVDPVAMSLIEDDRPGQVAVQVSVGDHLLGQVVENLPVRASRHWQYFEQKPELSFVEVSPENYMGRGGYHDEALERATDLWPIVTHGLTMSLGGTDFGLPDFLTVDDAA